MTKLRHRDVKSLAQGHAVRKGWGQNSNPGIVTLGPAWSVTLYRPETPPSQNSILFLSWFHYSFKKLWASWHPRAHSALTPITLVKTTHWLIFNSLTFREMKEGKSSQKWAFCNKADNQKVQYGMNPIAIYQVKASLLLCLSMVTPLSFSWQGQQWAPII